VNVALHLVATWLAYRCSSRSAPAEPDLRRSIELEPGDADAWSNLARLQRMNGQEEASRASQRRADELASAQRANTR